LNELNVEIVVCEGIEQWVREWLKDLDEEAVREKWKQVLNHYYGWEKENRRRKVIFIGTDITKGIVPVKLEERIWRDVTGRVFQDTASTCERVDLIWYGLSTRIK